MGDETVFPFETALRTRLETHLRSFPVQAADDSTLKHAAVAILIVPGEQAGDGASFLLTRRAARMNRHAGQWALPGGRVDEGETPEEAARREVHEELTLTLPADACLGRLDDYTTRSGYAISPFVFWADDITALWPNPEEVASVHWFPIAAFDRPDSPELLKGVDPDRPVLRIHLGPYDVNAPTGAILYQFWESAVNGRVIRVDHYDDPAFAWR